MSGGSADYNREHGGPEGMDPDGVIKSNWNEIVDNFDDINLKESLLRGIYAYGFEKPSAIQQRVIIPCIKGMMWLLKLSQVLARQPHLLFPSCNSWRLSSRRPKH